MVYRTAFTFSLGGYSMIKKRAAICFAFILVVSILSACSRAASTAITEIWPSEGLSVCCWFNGDEPEYSMGINTDPTTIRVGKTAKGNDAFSFLHLPLRGVFLPNEIESAQLYLKIVEGEIPSSLRIGLINGFWNNGITDLASAQKLIDHESAAAVSVKKAADGWVCMDITNYTNKR
jgi:hypothetical protein